LSIEWYTVHTYVGQEEKVKTNILNRAKSLGLADLIYQVVIPMEESFEHIGGGNKEVVKRKSLPGYIFVQMDLGDNPDEPNEAWEVVRYTPGVTGFIGTAKKAIPLSPSEEAQMLSNMGVMGSKERPKVQVKFNIGDMVQVVAGPFLDFTGIVSSLDLDKGKVKVLVSIFGRETPVELDFSQVIKT